MNTTDTHSITTEFFTAGGTLRPDSPSYVKRSTDNELINSVLSGEFSYVLTARQMGKSSLMVRTARQLQSNGINTAIIDLTQIGTVSADQWYVGLITQLTKRLKLTTDPLGWWKEHSRLGNVQSFSNFLRDVILVEVQGSVVIFVDEIDSTLRLSFRDDFFAAIRATYNARAYDPEFERLTFVLLGVASPTDLIMDRTRTPFNIGHEIALRKFSREDANILEKGLDVSYPQQGKAILDRIFYWTNGHPYLTQKLCQAIAEKKFKEYDNQKVDQLVEELFLSESARRETNLQFVRENILNYPDRRRILDIYKKVHQGTFVSDNKQSPSQNQLKLSGLVIAENGRLNLHNQIYHRVFNTHWIKENTPTNWKTLSFVLASVLGITLLVISGISLYDGWIETQANKAYASFYQTGSSKERVVYLAKILSLDGILDSTDYQYKAKELFFGLRPEEQLALFMVDPYDVNNTEVIVVAKGIYTSLADVDGADKTTPLLKAIKDSLDSVNNREDSKRLSAEIELWLDGRKLVTDGKLLEALGKYNLAIALNPDNISTLYERSRIFIKLSRYEEALVDLDIVLGVVKKSPAPTPTILPKTPTQSTITSQPAPSYQPSGIPEQPTSNASVTPTKVDASTTTIPTPTISSSVTPSPSSTPIAPITVISGFYTTAGIIKSTRDTIGNNPQLSLKLAEAPSTRYPNLSVFGLRPLPTSTSTQLLTTSAPTTTPLPTLGISTSQIPASTSTPIRTSIPPTSSFQSYCPPACTMTLPPGFHSWVKISDDIYEVTRRYVALRDFNRNNRAIASPTLRTGQPIILPSKDLILEYTRGNDSHPDNWKNSVRHPYDIVRADFPTYLRTLPSCDISNGSIGLCLLRLMKGEYTWENLATLVYGDSKQAGLLACNNIGYQDDLARDLYIGEPGAVIFAPQTTDAILIAPCKYLNDKQVLIEWNYTK